MYSVIKSIHIDFAHIVTGHLGHCSGIHGHTWCFEVSIGSQQLDLNTGFVLDFSTVRKNILQNIFDLLDHAFALDRATYNMIDPLILNSLSSIFHQRRIDNHGEAKAASCSINLKEKSDKVIPLPYVELIQLDSLKLAVFDFAPTSERLAYWLYTIAAIALSKSNCVNAQVLYSRVYETLHPVPTYAEYSP